MDGSSVGLVDDLDHISMGEDNVKDFTMQVLTLNSKHGTSQLSSGLRRSISDAVERNVASSAMDLYEVRNDIWC